MLRHIFSNLIDEMIKRDEVYRKDLNESVKQSGPPTSITIPPTGFGWPDNGAGSVTPRANGIAYPMTPGMGIGVATPGPLSHLAGVPEDGSALDKRSSTTSRTSGDKNGDYFGNAPADASPKSIPAEEIPKSPTDADKENGTKAFGKKFRMGMSFGSKKLGRSSSTAATEKPVVVEEKVEVESEPSESGGEKEKEVEDSFHGIVQRIRYDYDKLLLENPNQRVETGITPSLPNETPVLKIPPMTTVIIQEETSGGVADLYRGTVATVGEDASLIEARAPMWLGDLLLRVGSSHTSLLGNLLTRLEQNPTEGPCESLLHSTAMAGLTSQHRHSRRQFSLKR